MEMKVSPPDFTEWHFPSSWLLHMPHKCPLASHTLHSQLRLERDPSDSTLRELSSRSVLIDPLASVQVCGKSLCTYKHIIVNTIPYIGPFDILHIFPRGPK